MVLSETCLLFSWEYLRTTTTNNEQQPKYRAFQISFVGLRSQRKSGAVQYLDLWMVSGVYQVYTVYTGVPGAPGVPDPYSLYRCIRCTRSIQCIQYIQVHQVYQVYTVYTVVPGVSVPGLYSLWEILCEAAAWLSLARYIYIYLESWIGMKGKKTRLGP